MLAGLRLRMHLSQRMLMMIDLDGEEMLRLTDGLQVVSDGVREI